MTESRAALDDPNFMKALLNLVIPPSPSGDLPGAGALGLEPDLSATIRADPLLGPLVEAGAEAVREAALAEHPMGLVGMAPQAGTKVVEAQVASHPLFILGLLRYVYPAYYQHQLVLEGIGEPPRPPFPDGFDVDATDADLLVKLQAHQKA